MKILLSMSFVIIINFFANSADITWTNATGNNDFNTALNWNTGTVPGASDVAIFDGTSNANATLSSNVTLGGITVNGYTGTININSYSFQITSGNCDFTTGTITGGTLTINTTGTVRFAGTTFGTTVNSVSARVYLNGSTFNAVSTIEKNGAGNDNSSGGNTFSANTTITNSGSGYMRLGNGNPDVFTADFTLINSGSSYTLFATNSAGNSVGGNFIATNSGNGNTYLEINYNAASTLNITGNVTINNTGSGS